MGLLYFGLLCTIVAWQALGQSCYDKDGALITDDNIKPCLGANFCCNQVDVCFRGGFCFSTQWTRFYRGSCTSSNGGCTDMCQGEENEFGEAWLDRCLSGQLCCAGSDSLGGSGDSGCCGSDNTTDFVDWSGGPYLLNQVSSGEAVTYTTISTISTITQSAMGGLGGSSATSSSSVARKSCGSREVAIGAGVGVSLGVCLLAAVGVCAWLWVRNKNLSRRPQSLEVQQRSAGEYKSASYTDNPQLVSALSSPGGPKPFTHGHQHEMADGRPRHELSGGGN